MSSAFGVRIVAREQVQPLVRRADQLAHVFVEVRRERHVLDDLFGRFARQLLQSVSDFFQISATQSSRLIIEGTQPAPSSITPPRSLRWRSNTPSSTRLPTNVSAWLMQRGHVLAAHVLAAAEPVGRHRASGVHPVLVHLQRAAADVQHERHAASASAAQIGSRSSWPGRAAAARAMRHPRRAQPELHDVLELLQRDRVGSSSGSSATPMQARIALAEFGHRTVVRARGGVALFDRLLRLKRDRRRERREHELAVRSRAGRAPACALRPLKAPSAM